MGKTEQTTRMLLALEDKILNNSTPTEIMEALDYMFDSFMFDKNGCANDGTTRCNVYLHYKNLKAFLKELPEC